MNLHKMAKTEQQSLKKEDYKYRKIQPVSNGSSFVVVLPKTYAKNLDLRTEGFVKIQQQDNKMIIFYL
jgi:hypothetical protein